MRKLAKLAADANTMTSPSQDSNIWQGMIQALVAGLKAGYDQETGEAAFQVIIAALKDGLNERAKSALNLALRMQSAVNKFEKEG